MSVELCGALRPSLKAKLQNAGLLWIDDICRLTLGSAASGRVDAHSLQERGVSAADLVQRCPKLTQEEAVEVLRAVAPLYRGRDPAASDYCVPPAIYTLQDMLELEEDEGSERVTTFCKSIDVLLGGGVPVGAVTEVCGPPGVGKTQLLMQLAVSCALPRELGGLHGACLFIDTEGSFVPERFREIVHAAVLQVKGVILRQEADGFGSGSVTASEAEGATALTSSSGSSIGGVASSSPKTRKRGRTESARVSLAASAASFTVDYVLQQTQYIRLLDVVSLMAFLNVLSDYLTSHPAIRMVVIDSIAFPFRSFTQLGGHQQEGGAAEAGGDASSVSAKHLVWQRSRLLFSCGQLLQRYAREKKLCVIVSNQVTSRTVESNASEPKRVLVPALGDSWAYGLATRILLTQQHDTVLHGDAGRGKKESCHENVVFIEAPVSGGLEGGSVVNAVQHRVARLVKSPTQPRGQCCFSISQKGVRDVLRVWA
ncbi:putative meiotic recombination protein DMC1 [Trypanosoma grayi]|uniref:putative meiotic recombination protein DMC1 n=1 Tax=Trypanosoma grayi TaxID=71804 RepID=UPI0004F3F23D|nr:putative meiotic recombination protein DMC1 [Trypanosoma grayi]KEG14121.1 putative meiotic recombination protein DMC1 [Trypanosoma grayi]